MASGLTRNAAAFLIVFAPSQAARAAGPLVQIDSGTIAGVAEGDVQVFRGIPYAAPPVGPLRWKATQPLQPWTGVRDATRYGFACPQSLLHDSEYWAHVGPQSEDCLFLNVWRPARPGPYPVMVFIHGGMSTWGAAGVQLYDGTNLAQRGAVIVTVNYRLGKLGYFAHPALTRESPDGPLGNYAVMDQIEALRWVRRNIAQFSGDAHNVTIFGESAGAGSVQVLMSSPPARGLFDKAISESGWGLTAPMPIRGKAVSAEAIGERWTDSLGMHDVTVAQLRAIPVDEVVKDRSIPFLDGKVAVWAPGDSFFGHKTMDVPLLIGSNTNEGSIVGNNAAQAKVILGDAFAGLLAAYERRPGSTPTSAAIDLNEDAVTVLASVKVAEMHVANGGRAYVYSFNQVVASGRAGSIGAPHGSELEYLFGNRPPNHRWDTEDAKIAKLLGDYWVRFARTGNPNGGGDPHWPEVTALRTAYLTIGTPTYATWLTPLEQKVKALALDFAIRQWAATPKP